MYLPYQQGVPDLDLGVCVRWAASGTDDATALAGAADVSRIAGFASILRQTVREIDPGVDLLAVKPLALHVEAVFFAQRMASLLLTSLGGVALGLAAMGVYAVMAYAVGQRTQEFGVRMALGASAGDVLRLVLRQSLGLAVLGIAAGLGLAAGLTRLLASFLHGVSPFDATTFIGAPLLLAGVAVLACWLPARRATRVDPMTALRAE
jgi:ABC-type antimicrobial peptide transport system permease subunit